MKNEVCANCRRVVTDGLLVVKAHGLYLDDDLCEHRVCDECVTLREARGEMDGLELSVHYSAMP